MDVIQPEFIWIENRCYRKNVISSSYTGVHKNSIEHSTGEQYQPSSFYEADEYDNDYCDDPILEIPMQTLDDGRLRAKMAIASEYFPKIIGRSGDVKKRIEKETRTQITIPRKGQTGDLVITGVDHKGVISAHTQITMIVCSARKQFPFTHFISVSLINSEIKTQFAQFKKDVLTTVKGIDEDLFQKPEKLHLTIAPLVLLNDEERKRTTIALQSFREHISEIVGLHPIEIEVKGIEIMNDDPDRVDVLYGQIIDGSGRLQRLSDALVSSLEAEGLLDRQYDHVKLHATLMNSLFASKDDDQLQKGNRQTFRAKTILEKFKNYSFGKHSIDSLHLSQRHSTSPSNGYYVSTTQISLIENSS